MGSAAPRDAVLKALSPLESMLSADGYELQVATEQVPVELTVLPGAACGHCLIPRTLMEPMICDMLVAAGLEPNFTLNYPDTHVGT